ncbi:MAG: hypothetical protein OXG04_18315 [Acidobacteria bacterium]|nr:hypothetical protein [Acidobacteriota bacterium]
MSERPQDITTLAHEALYAEAKRYIDKLNSNCKPGERYCVNDLDEYPKDSFVLSLLRREFDGDIGEEIRGAIAFGCDSENGRITVHRPAGAGTKLFFEAKPVPNRTTYAYRVNGVDCTANEILRRALSNMPLDTVPDPE